MNEEDSVFAKSDSLVEVPYVEPSFMGSLNIKSMIPRSHHIRMNDMNNVMCYRNYDTGYVYVVVCCVKNAKYDDACNSHGITFVVKILKLIKFPNPNLERSLNFLISISQVHGLDLL